MPSYVTIIYSMVAAASFMLGLMHILFAVSAGKRISYIFSAIMAVAAGSTALLEMQLSMSISVVQYAQLIKYENFAIFMIVIPMTWFVWSYLGTGRTWLAVVITVLWLVGIIINMVTPNLTFSEIYEIERVYAYWGELYSIPRAEVNPWKFIADIASILILIFVIDASYRKYRKGERRKAVITGGSIVFFILVAGITTPLIDSGLIALPFMVSLSFMAIIFVFTYEIASDALRSNIIADEMIESNRLRFQAEENLRQARDKNEHYARKHLLGTLSAAIAHEINQPLSAIVNNAQAGKRILDSNPKDIGDIREIFDDLARDASRASEIIARLRSLLRTGTVKQESLSVNDVVKEVVQFMQYDLERNDITLVTDLANDDPIVLAGKIEMQQVLINLILNAIKATSSVLENDRLIEISSRINNENQVVLSVSDNGPGIPEEERETIFDLYHTNDTDKGLGLGLAISRRILDQHKAELTVEESTLGGAEFRIVMPREA